MAPSREDDDGHGAGDGPPPQRTAPEACGGEAERRRCTRRTIHYAD